MMISPRHRFLMIGAVAVRLAAAALFLAAVAALTFFGFTGARAADVPPKAATPSILSGYPAAGTSGWYFGLNSLMGAGSADVGQIAGLNSNSVTTTIGQIGGQIGYVWSPNPNVFAAVEAMFDAANFNGSAPGFSLGGPAAFEQRFKLGTPLSNFLSLFPNMGLPTVPPFPALPNGAVANNVVTYLMAGIHEDDVSLAYLQTTGKQWQIASSIGIGALGHLTNGIGIDVWAEVKFGSSALCAGPVACIKQGNTYMIGTAIDY